MRPVCSACNQRACAINCYRGEKVYYRSRCDYCIRRKRNQKLPIPRWKIAGYKKKTQCDRCGFRSKHATQVMVMHVDGNLNNTSFRNLKTVCLNCVAEIKRVNLPWQLGDLEPDV